MRQDYDYAGCGKEAIFVSASHEPIEPSLCSPTTYSRIP
eukprot:CAMPEP_0204851432 /NCGR_PEP_ID=MMETSP1347-20130617/9989_1 /ASSEMBLY_ACC=CAM_ASM_000690 /TAXON_ID=215587 /ORGANISM="Aplanochytrium stocchinoi, Strain GSBS06" /LENGTH=38 /DNA_ID= /DNA_START= /DNA_END= /DNA_ORIENTATION=